jgi:hypothetical protein
VKDLNRSFISVDAVKKFFREAALCTSRRNAERKNKVLQAALAIRRAATRARQCYTGACRPKMLRFISRHSNTPETNPLREAIFTLRRNPFCFQKD